MSRREARGAGGRLVGQYGLGQEEQYKKRLRSTEVGPDGSPQVGCRAELGFAGSCSTFGLCCPWWGTSGQGANIQTMSKGMSTRVSRLVNRGVRWGVKRVRWGLQLFGCGSDKV